jgi:hypothetical protein
VVATHGEVSIDELAVRGVYVTSSRVPSRERLLAPLTNPLGNFAYDSNIKPLEGTGMWNMRYVRVHVCNSGVYFSLSVSSLLSLTMS